MRGARPNNRLMKRVKSSLSPGVKQRLHREAKQWKLTDDEFARLLLALSETLRRGLPPNTNIDAKRMLTLVDNPMFGVLVEYVVKMASQSAVGDGGTETGAGATDQPPASTSNQAPSANASQLPSPTPAGPMLPPKVSPPPGWAFW